MRCRALSGNLVVWVWCSWRRLGEYKGARKSKQPDRYDFGRGDVIAQQTHRNRNAVLERSRRVDQKRLKQPASEALRHWPGKQIPHSKGEFRIIQASTKMRLAGIWYRITANYMQVPLRASDDGTHFVVKSRNLRL